MSDKPDRAEQWSLPAPARLLVPNVYVPLALGAAEAFDHHPMATAGFFTFAAADATLRVMRNNLTKLKKGEIGNAAAGYTLSMVFFMADLMGVRSVPAAVTEMGVGVSILVFGYHMLKDKPDQPEPHTLFTPKDKLDLD